MPLVDGGASPSSWGRTAAARAVGGASSAATLTALGRTAAAFPDRAGPRTEWSESGLKNSSSCFPVLLCAAPPLAVPLPRSASRARPIRPASSLAWLMVDDPGVRPAHAAGVERLDSVWPTRDAVSCLVFPAGDLSEEGRGRASARSS